MYVWVPDLLLGVSFIVFAALVAAAWWPLWAVGIVVLLAGLLAARWSTPNAVHWLR